MSRSATQRVEGNQRFQRGEPHLSGVARETLAELARGQHPFATILGRVEDSTSILMCGLSADLLFGLVTRSYSSRLSPKPNTR